MSITKNESHSEKFELLGERYLGKSIVSEGEIHDFIRTLRITDWDDFAARMQVVVDATSALIENNVDKIDQPSLRRIKQVARESKAKRYWQIMDAMVAAIEQGGEGIKLARQTALVAVDMVFIWTPEYFLALRQYTDKLRKVRLSSRKDA